MAVQDRLYEVCTNKMETLLQQLKEREAQLVEARYIEPARKSQQPISPEAIREAFEYHTQRKKRLMRDEEYKKIAFEYVGIRDTRQETWIGRLKILELERFINEQFSRRFREAS